jgi:hypothetical protein
MSYVPWEVHCAWWRVPEALLALAQRRPDTQRARFPRQIPGQQLGSSASRSGPVQRASHGAMAAAVLGIAYACPVPHSWMSKVALQTSTPTMLSIAW